MGWGGEGGDKSYSCICESVIFKYLKIVIMCVREGGGGVGGGRHLTEKKNDKNKMKIGATMTQT